MSNGKRESFVFYRSFQEAINEVEDSEKLIIYQSIANYALQREDPQLEGVAKIVWLLIKPQLDANWRKYDKGCKGGAPTGTSNNPAGRRGRNKPETNQELTTNKPETNQELTTNKPNVNDNDNVNINDNDNIYERFVPPTITDIESYIADNNLTVSADSFHDYYTSNGWMMGKNPMVNWQATLRNWSRKTEHENSSNNGGYNLQITLSNDL